MRKTLLSALMISLLLLTGCGSSQEEAKVGQFRADCAECTQICFLAELHTDDGSSAADYTLRCTRQGEETVMELLVPELISGVTARITGKEAALEFDGLSFAAGSIGTGNISPMEMPSVLLNGMKTGIASEICRETWADQTVLGFSADMGEGLSTRILLAEDTLSPVCGELFLQGKRIAECRISEWNME